MCLNPYLLSLTNLGVYNKSYSERVNEIVEFCKEKLKMDFEKWRDFLMEDPFHSEMSFTYLGPGMIEENAVGEKYNCILETHRLVYYFLSPVTDYDPRKD